ncbi:hypothetical protein U1Q18_037854 [Sarracenia purpurea var. burkii]
MGERPWGASSSIRAMKTSKQSRIRDSFRGSPGFQKQGKGGNGLNRFHVLSSGNYEECFPSLPGVISKAPIKQVRSADFSREPCGVTTPTDPVSDWVEEGRRLEILTVAALNRAKKGRSKFSQEEIDNLESWLARYRASYDQSVFVAPAVGHEKRAKSLMPNKMALSKSKEEQVSGGDKAKVDTEASSVVVVSDFAEAVGADRDKSSPTPSEGVEESENGGEEEFVENPEGEGSSPHSDLGALLDYDGEFVDDEENTEDMDGSGEEEGNANGESVIFGPVEDGEDHGGTEDGSVSIEKVPGPPSLLGDEVICFASGYNDSNADCQMIDDVSVGSDPCVQHKDKQTGVTGGCPTHAHYVFDLLLERTPKHKTTKGSASQLLESCLPSGATEDRIIGPVGHLPRTADCGELNESHPLVNLAKPSWADFAGGQDPSLKRWMGWVSWAFEWYVFGCFVLLGLCCKPWAMFVVLLMPVGC